MKKATILLALTLAACNQPVTRKPPADDGTFNPLWVKCQAGGFCDRLTEECAPATVDWPQGFCRYIGDDGRAYGSKRKHREADGGAP